MKKISEFVMDDESIDDLELKGLHIIQKKKGFRFGTDAVLLSYFTALKNNESVFDFCTGSGILLILFAGKSGSEKIYGIEIQEKYASMAKRSVLLNELEDRVSIIHGDIKDISLLKSFGKFDVVTANPPYKISGTGIVNPEDEMSVARHEVMMNLDDLIKGADAVLKDSGRLVLVHRPERLIDIVETMRKYNIEPKRIRMVAPSSGKAPNMILIEGKKNQKPYLKWESQIEVYNEDGTNTDLIREIYGDKRHG